MVCRRREEGMVMDTVMGMVTGMAMDMAMKVTNIKMKKKRIPFFLTY